MSKLPEWPVVPLKAAMATIERIGDVLHLSMNGISVISKRVALVEALNKLDEAQGNGDGQANERLEKAQKDAQLADHELRTGFPVLHSQATILLYSALETAIKDVVVAFIMNRPETWTSPALQKVQVNASEFMALDLDQRARLVVAQLEREPKTQFAGIAARFEQLLDAIGLGGTVDEETKRVLQEFGHIRHAIVHHGSRADTRLVKNCPWLNLKVGDEVIVSHENWGKFSAAVSRYLGEVVYRVAEMFGTSIRPIRKE